jgi:hypothetical protein
MVKEIWGYIKGVRGDNGRRFEILMIQLCIGVGIVEYW